MKYLSYAVFILILSACAKEQASPPVPCGQGLNTDQCKVNISEHSTWTEVQTLAKTDSKTGKALRDEEIDFVTTYEFSVKQGEPVWRRTMTVTTQGQAKTMFEEGTVVSNDGSKLVLKETYSSCDDEDPSYQSNAPTFTTYYSRDGKTLGLDSNPPAKFQSTGGPVGDVFGIFFSAMMSATTDSLEDFFGEVFTWGSARTYLETGRGTFTSQPKEDTAVGSYVCFASFGSGTKPSQHVPSTF